MSDAMERAAANLYRLEGLGRLLEEMPGEDRDLVHSAHVRGTAGVMDVVLELVEDDLAQARKASTEPADEITGALADLTRLRSLVQLLETMGGGSDDQVGAESIRGMGGVIAAHVSLIQGFRGLSDERSGQNFLTREGLM
jgi:AcrR family transcriptional regulator